MRDLVWGFEQKRERRQFMDTPWVTRMSKTSSLLTLGISLTISQASEKVQNKAGGLSVNLHREMQKFMKIKTARRKPKLQRKSLSFQSFQIKDFTLNQA